MPIHGSMSTRHMRNSWRGPTELPAGSLPKYILRNTVATPVTPALTPRACSYHSGSIGHCRPGTGWRRAATPSAGRDTRRVELTPLPGLTQQFAIQVEWEIQKQIQECSHQLVQDVLQRSTNQIMPPTPLEAARASLSQCFQKALAPPRTKPAPPPEQSRGSTKWGTDPVFTG